MSEKRKAIIHRMVLPGHECPYGRHAMRLLRDHGFEVEDHLLTSREAVESFKAEHSLSTTPLIVIDGHEIGGSEELEQFLEGASAEG